MKGTTRWRRALVTLVSVGLSVAAARAESVPEQRQEPARWSVAATGPNFDAVDKYALSLDARFGIASSPFVTRSFPVVRGHGFVLQGAGAFRLRNDMLLGFRMPMVMVSIAQPGGSYLDVFTWGNPRFSFQQRHELKRWSSFRARGLVGATLALPIAEQGPAGSLFALRALQVASSLDALREQDLYTSAAVPVSGSYGVVVEDARFGLEANLRVPIFFRFGRADLPPDAKTRTVGASAVLHVGVRAAATRWFEIALAADTVFNAFPTVKPERDTPTTQFALAPSVSFRLASSWRLAANAVLPVAGPLGGHAGAGGLQLSFEPPPAGPSR